MFRIGSNLTIIKNFSYLSFIQILTLLIPFIYYPYLIRKFNLEQYGLIIFIQSIVMIFAIIIDFGFNIYGTKLASENRYEINKLNEAYTNICAIKLILMICCFFIFLIFVFYNHNLRENINLSILLYFILIGDVLFSQWLFQGLEEIKLAAIINLVSKIVLLGFVFIGTNTRLGFYAFPLGLVTSSIMNGIQSYFMIKYKFKIEFTKVSLKTFWTYVTESYSFLLSRAVGTIIIRVNAYILGNYVGFTQVAYYDLAEKLISLLIMPVNMLNQVIYPHIVRNKKYTIALNIIKYFIPLYLFIYLASYFLGEHFIIMFAGENMAPAFLIFSILFLTLFTNTISYFLGNCVLVVYGKKQDFNNSIYIGLLFYTISLLITLSFININAFTLTWLIVINSFIICLHRIIKVYNYKIYSKLL
ncbi:oligosaccharide flippase family protein [Xenorhabdus miraniensis]|uniref:Putative polysaccharide transporter n=1 Tax=Xenorhabdus miraniensis TaxID=351674 RepID=A0A2D0JM43_9GAMM|nr:oligosaccharide flippase family protein [Xenorhabdus miraniensis]PHM47221.1 putative polysaccharide transporter [Xenorhabdus miraniensis]